MRENPGPISMALVASDPITSSGARFYLGSHPQVRLLPDGDPGEADVLVVLAVETTEETLQSMEPATRQAGGQDMRIMLVADSISDAQLMRAITLGLVCILPRSSSTFAHIVDAAAHIAAGGADLPGPMLRSLIEQLKAIQVNVLAPLDMTPAGITRRETDVLRMLADGLDTAEMAEKLSYSERTIKNVLRGMMKRHNLRNRAHAVAYALRAGVL